MGYESKIIVAKLCNLAPFYDDEFSVELARMNLSKAGGIEKIFNEPVTWKMYGDNDCDMTEDKYGDTCRYTDIQTVIDWLEKAKTKEHYRRLAPALAMLRAYAAEIWGDPLIVIHYGY